MSIQAEAHDFNPMISPDREDPTAFYKWARDENVIPFSEALGAYLVTRYEDLRAVALDVGTFSSFPSVGSVWDNPPEVVAALEGCLPEMTNLINTDEPDHAPLRRVFQLAFSRKRVEALLPVMEARATELVDRFDGDHAAELVAQFAKPYVRYMISRAVGVDEGDMARVDAWNQSWITLFNPMAPIEEKLAAAEDYKQYERYCIELMRQRRQERRDDLASDLMHGAEDVEPVSIPQAVYLFRGANAAGFDTTRDAIMSTVLNMMRERELWDRAADDRRQIVKIVEESLRRDAPHRGLMRLATRDAEINGKHIPAGARLLLLFGSGNLDERQYENPGILDLERDNPRAHLAFGLGLHQCCGAMMARAEAATGIEVLRRRLPDLALAPGYQPVYEASYFFRSLERLDVVW